MNNASKTSKAHIGEVERGVIFERYMENGPIWDTIANDIVRHERFRNIPANVQELYANNVGNRRAGRRRLRDFIAREQRK